MNTYYVIGPDKNDNNKNKILGQFYSIEYARVFALAYYNEYFSSEDRNPVSVFSSTELVEFMSNN